MPNFQRLRLDDERSLTVCEELRVRHRNPEGYCAGVRPSSSLELGRPGCPGWSGVVRQVVCLDSTLGSSTHRQYCV